MDGEKSNKPGRPIPILVVTGCLLTWAIALFAFPVLIILIALLSPNPSWTAALGCLVPGLPIILLSIFLLVMAWGFYHGKPSAYWFVVDHGVYRIPGLYYLTRAGKELDRPEVRQAFGFLPLTPKDKRDPSLD